ncbi:MAG: M67 family metallopeptidase [Anaerolineaceae bacterium]
MKDIEKLVIWKSLWLTMIAHAEECLPEECCGLAAGLKNTIEEIIPVENSLHSPFEFQMDAGGQIREMLRMEKEGLELVAIFHSHPTGPGIPSIRDKKNFMYPESYSIILSRKNKIWNGRGFRISDKTIEEITILIL